MMKRKAEGLSLNVVVIAVIALVVLVVLILIFSGKLGGFNKEVQSCPGGSSESCAKDGMCKSKTGEYTDLPVKVIGSGDSQIYCCMKNDQCSS